LSVPNQKIVRIHKPSYEERFLQIGISEWREAHKQMNYSTFCMYLYLAGNKDGFNLELSQEAFANAVGFKKTAYHDAIKRLAELNYLTWNHGNVWDFHATPDRSGGSRFGEQKTPPPRNQNSASTSKPLRPTNIEIDNINNNKYKIDTPMESDRKGEADWNKAFNEYSAQDDETAKIGAHLATLSAQRKMDYLKTAQSLGKSTLWLRTAIRNKEATEWEKHGFGLLRSREYQEEITEMVEEEKKRFERLQEGIKQQQEAMARQEKIVLKQTKRRSIRDRAIDLDAINRMEDN